MNKDVIYIDVDDDVTTIIGKIKKSKEKIVALVPPKRAGALQSAVNLRLLDRMAKSAKKQLVLITHSPALMALAANATIPVARNLQSRPEIAEVPALVVDDGDDIIDGSQLPIGEHARTAPGDKDTSGRGSRSDAIDELDNSDEPGDNEVIELPVAGVAVGASRARGRSEATKPKIKIPNFDKFRQRLFLIIGGGVLLVGLLIWMFGFAPAATVVITARTAPAPVSATIILGGDKPSAVDKNTLTSTSQELKKDETVEFEATGTANKGDKATGTMEITRTSISSTPMTVPAGTRFTSGAYSFVSTEATTLDGTEIGPGGVIQDSKTVPVEAAEAGEEYNLSARSYQSSMSGMSANGSDMSGGTTNMVKVPTSSDIEQAKGRLVGQATGEAKQELLAKFTAGEKVIDSSFTVKRGKPVASPATGEEAKEGKATLTITTTYTVQAIPSLELETYLRHLLTQQLSGNTAQEVFDTGIASVGLSNYVSDNKGKTQTVSLSATGQIGPRIDEAAIKESVKGKIYGEVQASLQMIEGVQEVDVRFSYFWVRTVPNDTNKITIEFELVNE